MPDEPDRPQYTVYRSRPRLLGKRDNGDGLRELRGEQPQSAPGAGQQPYTVHRAGRGRLRLPRLRRPKPPGVGKVAAGITVGRVVKWIALAAVSWILISVALFLVSAQIERGKVSNNAKDALTSAGNPLTSANTILVLGSDARVKGLAEPGSQIGGPSRSDSIMLIRTGGGKSARLSIPRDTVVDIPGHGRDKINAAYAIGGPALTITTIKQNFGIDVNHLVEVNFANFPQFIDSLGGITVKTTCVVSRINGGTRNGGYTLRLRAGEHHINGKQALALARTRHNDCNRRESDLTRERRQQKILAAIKSRLVSPVTFFRLPWVAWHAPKAIRTDMAGPTLLGLFGAIETGGSPKTEVMVDNPPHFVNINGASGIETSRATIQRDVARFLKG